MGVCMSRCSDGRLKSSSMVAATDSNQFYSFANTTAPPDSPTAPPDSPYNPNLSLKRFLHLNADITDPKKSFSSTPRTSLAESTAIPPSSELFSLPGSELDPRSSFVLSPSTSRASFSSHLSLSPRGPKNRVRPAIDLAAHPRLVEAIARLERLNEGKNFSQAPRSLSFRSSDFEHTPRSGELKRSVTTSRSRCVRHYQLPLSKPSLSGAVPLESSFTELLDEVEQFVAFVEEAPPRLSVSSEAALREAHMVVPTKSLNRLSSCGFQEDYDGEEMFTFFEASRWVETDQFLETKKQSPVRKSGSLQRLLQAAPEACQTSPVTVESAKSVTECQSSASNFCQGSRHFVEESKMNACVEAKDPLLEKSSVAESGDAAMPSVMEILPKSMRGSCKSPSSNLHPVRPLMGQLQTAVTAETHVSADPSKESLREEEGDAAAAAAASTRPALKSPSVKRSSPSRTRALSKRSRRRLSRSLDSIEDTVIHVGFEFYRNAAKAVPTSRLSSASSSNTNREAQATFVDAKSTEENLPVSSCDLEQSGSEQKEEEDCCPEFVDTSPTAELAASESPPQEVAYLVEDPIRSTENAESSLPEPENLDSENAAAPEPRPGTKARCEETPPTEKTRYAESEGAHITSKLDSSCADAALVVLRSIPDVEPEGGASQRFLLKAFNSLLKLLRASDPEQAEFQEYSIMARDADEENQYGIMPMHGTAKRVNYT